MASANLTQKEFIAWMNQSIGKRYDADGLTN